MREDSKQCYLTVGGCHPPCQHNMRVFPGVQVPTHGGSTGGATRSVPDQKITSIYVNRVSFSVILLSTPPPISLSHSVSLSLFAFSLHTFIYLYLLITYLLIYLVTYIVFSPSNSNSFSPGLTFSHAHLALCFVYMYPQQPSMHPEFHGRSPYSVPQL